MMVNNEKGQSLVEFCLIVPLFLLMIIGMIYGGFAYADYLQYSTAVREAARDIAIQDKDKREALLTGLSNNTAGTIGRYVDPLTTLYNPRFSVRMIEEDTPGSGEEGSSVQTKMRFVEVSVILDLDKDVSILPERLGPLQCTMPIEQELDGDDDD